MIIRKSFKFEGGHIVHRSFSKRCRESFHGHSYEVEFFFKPLDPCILQDCGMILDFGILKSFLKDAVDIFDHTFVLWNKAQYVSSVKELSDRFIVSDFIPTAENFALYFLAVAETGLNNVVWERYPGEKLHKFLYCSGVRVHETSTGYAESEWDDLSYIFNQMSPSISLSDSLKEKLTLTQIALYEEPTASQSSTPIVINSFEI